MRSSRFAIAAFFLSFVPLVTHAASVLMVQFGSFETQAEAQERLDKVKSTHGEKLGNLPTLVREVKLPPDNLTVFRTQAGPLESRTAAQALCVSLAESGDECYVVETVAKGPAASAGRHAASSKLNAQPQPLPVNPASPVVSPAPAPQEAPPAPAEAASFAAPVVQTEPSNSASPALESAMEKAAAEQQLSENVPAATPAAAENSVPADGSFWSRMNPFRQNEQESARLVEEKKRLESEAASAREASQKLAAQSAPTPSVEAASLVADPATSMVAPDQLPPLPTPPTPSVALNSPVVELPAVTYTPEPLPAFTSTPLEAQSATSTPSGSVQVEEAKRVPLTEIEIRPATASAEPIAEPPVSLLPISTIGQKTLWAQVGQFKNSHAALVFWENFRQTNPDFPVVRVRIASSIQQAQRGNLNVWLRVGPFSRGSSIKNLCMTLREREESPARCGQVTDIGVSADARPARGGTQNGTRYKR